MSEDTAVEEVVEFVEIPKVYEDEVNMNVARAISGLSPQRFRKLTILGQVPAKKNIQGFWKFSRAEITEWATGRATAPRTHASPDGKKAFVIKVDALQMKTLTEFLASSLPGVTLEARYKKNAAGATRAKKAAKGAKTMSPAMAAKLAAAKAEQYPVAK